MQTTFPFGIGVAIIAIFFALTLSVLDHGITVTVVKYIDPWCAGQRDRSGTALIIAAPAVKHHAEQN
jgi:hypothetical protein